jgi:cell division protein FtsB
MLDRRRPGYGIVLPISLLSFGCYFAFAAIQGEYGVFRRIALEAELADLGAELALLEAEVARMTERTERLSNDYLDLDLLDERARVVLGYARIDEIVID